MGKRSLIMRKNVTRSLLLLSGIGLSGFLLLKKKSRPTSKTDVFYSALKGSGYESMRWLIIAQAKVESANFTSNLFITQNNAFGMKNAKIRDTTGFPVKGTDFAFYDNLTDSIYDLILWFRSTNFPIVSDVHTYVRKLKERGYFEENQSDYINAMNSWL